MNKKIDIKIIVYLYLLPDKIRMQHGRKEAIETICSVLTFHRQIIIEWCNGYQNIKEFS